MCGVHLRFEPKIIRVCTTLTVLLCSSFSRSSPLLHIMNNPPSTNGLVDPTSIVAALSTNKYLISLAAVFVILGSRDLIIEMNSSCKSIFRTSIVKKIVLFSSMFLYARDIRSAAVVSVVMMCAFPHIFFEDSEFEVKKGDLRCF